MNIVSAFINSNLFISLAALALTVATQIQLGIGNGWHPYLFIVFFATLFEYNLHRLITVLVEDDAQHSEKHSWAIENKKKFIGIVLFSLVGFVASTILAEVRVLEVFAAIALLTVFYSMPVGSRSKKLFKLREIPYLKLFVIAFVWSTTTILLPVIHTERDLNNVDVILMLFERFLFVLAITIPFDIRDLNVDKSVGLKTIPIRIGERRSWLISYACLTMFAVVSYLHYYMQSNQFVIYALGVSTLMTFYFLMSKRWKKTRWYFYGILDGMMLLQGALVILFWSIY